MTEPDATPAPSPAASKPPAPPKSSWNLAEGEEAVPHCTIITRLGGGARYEVFSAWDDRRLATVVAKVVRPDSVEHRGTIRSLRREISILKQLDHPSIVRLFDGSASGDRPFVTMERAPGRTVASSIRKHGPMSLDHVMSLGMGVFSGLHYLHGREVVHLDIKPSNVLMDRHPTIIDFSLARSISHAASLTGHVGTNDFMAPEQCDPQAIGQPGPPSDVWGAGTLLFFAITGNRPFGKGVRDESAPLAERFPQLARKPDELPADLPAALAATVLACLDPEPAARPTPAEAFNSIREVAGEAPAPASDASAATGPVIVLPTSTTKTAADPTKAQFRTALRAKNSASRNRRPGR